MNPLLPENLNTVSKLKKQQYEQLYKISRLLNEPVYEDSLINEVIDIVVSFLGAERGLFVKYDNIKNDFELVAARNLKQESLGDLREFSSGILKKVIDKREPLLYHDALTDPSVSGFESIQLSGINSIIAVPVLREGEVWGILLADSRLNRKDFNLKSLQFLEFLGSLFSLSLDRVAKVERLKEENEILQNIFHSSGSVPSMIGISKPMRDLARLIHKASQTDATILLLGESGTGKDLTAQAIHKLSRRHSGPFIAQFCGSIPDQLLESELFGYKKGAFTGASADKKGLLEAADLGTFFMDEIGEISQSVQAKLLRVIEYKEIMRLGDSAVKKINVRIIAATNKDLHKMSLNGKFRHDLFYRLNVFPIMLPSLRDRKEDIPLLANYFIKQFTGRDVLLTRQAVEKLESYDWPGNVRQLMNVIQRAVILHDTGRLDAPHLIWESGKAPHEFTGALSDYQRALILRRLREFKGNRTHAANSLGVSVRWIQLKLKEYGLS